MSRALLLVAHGSRDDAAQATTEALADLVRAELPGVEVALGYLDHVAPSVPDALSALLRDNDAVTAVPLFFAPGKHVDVDLPAITAHAAVTVAPPLGPDPLVAAALRDRLIEADAPPDAVVVVVAAGSNVPASALSLEATARALADGTGWQVIATDASADLGDVIRSERRANDEALVAVAPLLLASGTFADRITSAALAAGADVVAPPIGVHPAIALLVAKRYTSSTEVAA